MIQLAIICITLSTVFNIIYLPITLFILTKSKKNLIIICGRGFPLSMRTLKSPYQIYKCDKQVDYRSSQDDVIQVVVVLAISIFLRHLFLPPVLLCFPQAHLYYILSVPVCQHLFLFFYHIVSFWELCYNTGHKEVLYENQF